VDDFKKPDVFFCGWVHYLAFDLLVARGMALDAVNGCKVSYIQYYCTVVPCLVATLYVGPVGYLLYMVLRYAFLKKPVTESPSSSVPGGRKKRN
jgi:Domain of unknown function (DUF4281)